MTKVPKVVIYLSSHGPGGPGGPAVSGALHHDGCGDEEEGGEEQEVVVMEGRSEGEVRGGGGGEHVTLHGRGICKSKS